MALCGELAMEGAVDLPYGTLRDEGIELGKVTFLWQQCCCLEKLFRTLNAVISNAAYRQLLQEQLFVLRATQLHCVGRAWNW
jgi:hypothetical protein